MAPRFINVQQPSGTPIDTWKDNRFCHKSQGIVNIKQSKHVTGGKNVLHGDVLKLPLGIHPLSNWSDEYSGTDVQVMINNKPLIVNAGKTSVIVVEWDGSWALI